MSSFTQTSNLKYAIAAVLIFSCQFLSPNWSNHVSLRTPSLTIGNQAITFLDYCILAFSDKSMTAIASVMMHYGFVTDKKL